LELSPRVFALEGLLELGAEHELEELAVSERFDCVEMLSGSERGTAESIHDRADALEVGTVIPPAARASRSRARPISGLTPEIGAELLVEMFRCARLEP
jgi:hypothetical protein